jgi:hypothetical protein
MADEIAADEHIVLDGSGNHEAAVEELQTIKAHTMYRMVEELNANQFLLFLTNKQVELLANRPDSLTKMLEVLEVPKPKLVINLLPSTGDRMEVCAWPAADLKAFQVFGAAGIVPGKPPFFSREDERATTERLDQFMASVLIPLAVSTNAIVICAALECDCMLASSFTRMYNLKRASWGERPPFSILSICDVSLYLYANEQKDAHWRHVRDSSNAWRQREGAMRKAARAAFGNKEHPEQPLSGYQHDLDPNAMIYIIADCVDSTHGTMNTTPMNKFIAELTRQLASTLPSVALKTGKSWKETTATTSRHSAGLFHALQMALTGTPLLFLDQRVRSADVCMDAESNPVTDRATLIARALEVHNGECDKYLALAQAGEASIEFLDCDTLAYFHDILFGDGDSSTHDTRQTKETQQRIPVHKAIERARINFYAGAVEAQDGSLAPPSQKQIADVAAFIADRYFHDGWRVLPDWQEREDQGQTYSEHYEPFIFGLSMYARTLLNSPNFHHLSLGMSSVDTANDLMSTLVQLDRLPKRNSLEGLELLRHAWNEYDVAVLLAQRYKRLFKLLFIVRLLLGFLVVASATMSNALAVAAGGGSDNSDVEDEQLYKWSRGLVEGSFFTSIAASLVISLEALTDARGRWRILRSGADSLLSMIWMYRTRVGMFELDLNNRDSSRPEVTLCHALNEWRSEVLGAASLANSSLNRLYPAKTYRHCQLGGELASGADDDFHSPTQPYRYIVLRVYTMERFFQERIPQNARQGFWLKVLIVMLGFTASVMARYNLISWVVLVSSFAASATVWNEFMDASRKTERYNRAVSSIRALLSWWSSLSEVEKCSREAISHLIVSSEAILSEERLAWLSTAALSGVDKAPSDASDDQAGTDQTQGSTTTRRARGNQVAPMPSA